jgi:tetratricopeptide (TPR) repeat protein
LIACHDAIEEGLSTMSLDSKLDRAVAAVLARHEPKLKSIHAIGSATHERTAASDLDVSVVFDDDYYMARARELRTELAAVADEINRTEDGPELVLWPSKFDHSLTFVPDVSYVRANLPTADERLDAWCGLAKHVLQHYESATIRRLWGEIELEPWWKIPATEAVELYLLATRTFAEGLAEAHAPDPAVRRLGNNHLAKALLRAVYAWLLASDQQPRNSYAEIHRAATELVGAAHRDTLDAAYQAKTAATSLLGAVPLERVVALLRECEAAVAAAPRWRIGGLATGRAGESFGFDPESLEPRPIERYRRCPVPDDNFVEFGYFVLTAPIVLERIGAAQPSADVADLYLEESAAVVVYALLGNQVAVRFGQREAEVVQRPIGAGTLAHAVGQLELLADAYVRPGAERFGRPWLSLHGKRRRVAALLRVLDGHGALTVSPAALERLEASVGVDGVIDGLEWIADLAGGTFTVGGLDLLTRLGLSLYQHGEAPRARRVLARAAEFARVEVEAGPEALRGLDQLRSRALQMYAITLHRDGDLAAAQAHYEEALDRDPDNFSALDDLANLLVTQRSPDAARDVLLARLGRVREHVADATQQVVNRAVNRAIDLREAGDLATSEQWYLLALAADPGVAMTHFNYGLALEHAGRLEEAVGEYAAALDLDPGYVKAHMRLLECLEALGAEG